VPSGRLREYDGPFLSDNELAEKFMAEDNPELAKRWQRERLEEEDLRKRAPDDPQAAATLERILKDRLQGVEAWVRDMRRLHALGQAETGDLATAEASLQKLNEHLAWCRSLTRGHD